MFTLTPKTPRTLSGVGSSGRGVGGADRDSHSSFLISQSRSSNHSQPDPQPQRGYLRPQPLRNPSFPPHPRLRPVPGPLPRAAGTQAHLPWRGVQALWGELHGGGGGWGGPSLLPCVLSASISFQKLAAELEMSPPPASPSFPPSASISPEGPGIHRQLIHNFIGTSFHTSSHQPLSLH